MADCTHKNDLKRTLKPWISQIRKEYKEKIYFKKIIIIMIINQIVFVQFEMEAVMAAERAQSRAQRHQNQVVLGLRCCWTRITTSEGVDGGEFIRLEKESPLCCWTTAGMTIIPKQFNGIISSVDTWETELLNRQWRHPFKLRSISHQFHCYPINCRRLLLPLVDIGH